MTVRGDLELVEAMQAGHEGALSDFDRRFRSKIEAFARRRGVVRHDCVDVAQDVLAEAMRQIGEGKFRGASALSTWLHPMMNGKVADYFRKRSRRAAASLEDVPESSGPLMVVGDSDTVLAVREALSRLQAEDRLLLILHEQQGYTLQEIGPLLGLRKSAVAERLIRARERFRLALAGG